MKAPIISNEKVDLDLADEVMGFGFKVGIAVCSLIGAWAVSCLLAGLIKFGAVNMMKGYITAVTGM